MEAAEGAAKQSCAVHPDRAAVGRCAACGRSTCLACAIAFRGEIRCATCAARELGDPAPEPVAGPARSRFDVVAVVAFAVALLATAPPWDRFGALTGVLSAWRPSLGVGSAVAGVALLLATAGAGVGVMRPTRGRWPTVATLAAGGGALLGAAWFLLTSPDYATHTPMPYLTLLAAAVGTGALAVRTARLGGAAGPSRP